MTGTVTVYDVVLWVHITAVIAGFGTLFAYPLLLVVNARSPIAQRAGFHRLQIAFSKRITGPAIAVILAAGVYLASDRHLWGRAWVTVGLVLLATIATLGITVLRRGEEALMEHAQTGDSTRYDATLRTLLAWTSLTVALIVVTVFFMAAKPFA